jgi:exoribonuclease II
LLALFGTEKHRHMYLLFEEDGGFKSGTLLVDGDASVQVEMPTGKRCKVKSASVLLRFATPSAAQLLEFAEPMAAEIEPDFLWECVSEGEFNFLDCARDYVGHEPSAIEAASVLLALHSAPIYFHRKGKGRYRKAPADILQAALAGLEKKRQQTLVLEQWVDRLKAGELPSEIAPFTDSLLGKPDRNKQEIKAVEAACEALGFSTDQLLFHVGALRSAYDLHFRRFLQDQFPKGLGFPAFEEPIAADNLPRADVRAFSIDDANTTEIDDALSVMRLPGIGWRIGIHIAAPALGIAPSSALGAIARARLSTVYMPGNKITMLPDEVVRQFTLDGGKDCPAVSLYLNVSDDLEIVSHESRLERVHIAENLRHHSIEPIFNADSIANNFADVGDFPFRDDLLLLWKFANACEGRRGKPSATQGINDYNFAIEGDLADPDECRVIISERQRGSPLDKLVAELMIVANATWGGLLAEKKVAALYRAQTGGKVRMTTSPLPHEGLGVAQYAWSTSPLRRFVDMVNQWQLIACLQEQTPVYAQRSAELFAAMRDFELTYAAYAEFQRKMERYWSLRWLAQEGVTECEATVRRGQNIKIDHLPILIPLPSLPSDVQPGQRIRISVGEQNLLNLSLDCRYLSTLEGTVTGVADEEEDVVEIVLSEAEQALPEPAPASDVFTEANEEVKG